MQSLIGFIAFPRSPNFLAIYRNKNLIRHFIAFKVSKLRWHRCLAMSSDSQDLSTHTRPYTVGVSIAAVLIFFITLFHIWRFALKKIKKFLNINQLEAVIVEIPEKNHEGRKLSSSCVQQLDMILSYSDDPSETYLVHTQKRVSRRSLSENSSRLETNSARRKRNSIAGQRERQSTSQQENVSKAIFFAGYSHRHINDA